MEIEEAKNQEIQQQLEQQQQQTQYEDQGDEYIAIFYKCCGFIFVLIQFFLWFHTIYAMVFEYFPFYFNDSSLLYYSCSTSVVTLIVCGLRALLLGNIYNSDATKHPQIVKELAKLNKSNYEKQCLPCNIIKSKDIHHCSICNRCILRLDHHCYFFGTCIGELNYRFFLTYITTTFINGIIVVLTLQPQMKLLIHFEFDEIQGRIWRLIVLYCLAWLFGIMFNSCLIFNHLYFLSNNIRYIEFKYQIKKPKYGCCRMMKIMFCCGDQDSSVIKDFHKTWCQIQQSKNYLRLFYPKFQRYNNNKFVEIIREMDMEEGQIYEQPEEINNEMDVKLSINSETKRSTDINYESKESQEIQIQQQDVQNNMQDNSDSDQEQNIQNNNNNGDDSSDSSSQDSEEL